MGGETVACLAACGRRRQIALSPLFVAETATAVAAVRRRWLPGLPALSVRHCHAEERGSVIRRKMENIFRATRILQWVQILPEEARLLCLRNFMLEEDPMRALSALALATTLIWGGVASAERLTDQPLVDAAWLQQHLDNESLVVLDIRDVVQNANPYEQGHIPGAVSAPYSSAGWRTEVQGVPGQLPPLEQIQALIGNLGIDNDAHVVIVPSGTDSSEFGGATRIYWTFKTLGHDAVSILDGGWRGWQAASGEVSADPVKREPKQFLAKIRDEYLATTADVEKALQDGVKLVDGRPVDQYEGKAKSPVVRAAGTIPGSANIPHSKFYDAEKDRFATREEIEVLTREAGLSLDEDIITFCNTGHWASIPWFALSEVAGNKKTRMYDGSMAEWAADPSRPLQY